MDGYGLHVGTWSHHPKISSSYHPPPPPWLLASKIREFGAGHLSSGWNNFTYIRGEITPLNPFLFGKFIWGPVYTSICNDRLETPTLVTIGLFFWRHFLSISWWVQPTTLRTKQLYLPRRGEIFRSAKPYENHGNHWSFWDFQQTRILCDSCCLFDFIRFLVKPKKTRATRVAGRWVWTKNCGCEKALETIRKLLGNSTTIWFLGWPVLEKPSPLKTTQIENCWLGLVDIYSSKRFCPYERAKHIAWRYA